MKFRNQAGDWNCPGCTFFNFGWRESCGMCEQNKPPPQQKAVNGPKSKTDEQNTQVAVAQQQQQHQHQEQQQQREHHFQQCATDIKAAARRRTATHIHAYTHIHNLHLHLHVHVHIHIHTYTDRPRPAAPRLHVRREGAVHKRPGRHAEAEDVRAELGGRNKLTHSPG